MRRKREGVKGERKGIFRIKILATALKRGVTTGSRLETWWN